MPSRRVEQLVDSMTDQEYHEAEESYDTFHPQAALMSFEEYMEEPGFEEEFEYELEEASRGGNARGSNAFGRSHYVGLGYPMMGPEFLSHVEIVILMRAVLPMVMVIVIVLVEEEATRLSLTTNHSLKILIVSALKEDVAYSALAYNPGRPVLVVQDLQQLRDMVIVLEPRHLLLVVE